MREKMTRLSEVEKLLEIGGREPSVPPGLAAGYLPSFESAVAVTATTAAVMTTAGVYESARLSPRADPRQRGLNVRFNQDRIVEATVSCAACIAPAIRFRNLGGAIGHTTYLTAQGDLCALQCLALSAASAAPPVLPNEEPQSRLPASRRKPKAAHAVDGQAIPHLIDHLATLRLPLTLVLCNEGCLHCDDGALEGVSRNGGLVFLRMERTTLSFDPARIGGWRIRPCETDPARPVLEALCPLGRRQFYLTHGPEECAAMRESWQNLLGSLPARDAGS